MSAAACAGAAAIIATNNRYQGPRWTYDEKGEVRFLTKEENVAMDGIEAEESEKHMAKLMMWQLCATGSMLLMVLIEMFVRYICHLYAN